MILSIVGTVLICQLLALWYHLGLSYVFISTFATVSGTLAALFLFWFYTEMKLFIQNFSKVNLSGKCVFITGCDSGFGLKLAETLAKKGVFVYAAVLNPDSTGASNLQSLPQVKVIKMDVTVDEDVRQAFETVDNHLRDTRKGLWAVVNNAGILHVGMMEFTKVEKVRQVIDVNVLGILRVCQRFAPLLRGHGRIVNLTSVAGLYVSPFIGAYCVSKHAAEALSQSLRIEMHALNLPVITVCPGGYRTAILEDLHKKMYGPQEIKLYGEGFMEKCQNVLTNWFNIANKNTQEVVNSVQNALFNVNFQYSYIPNFKVRIYMYIVNCLSVEYRVKTGCKGTTLFIPTTID